MFELWLVTTGILAYAIVAATWCPPPAQMEKEFRDAEARYGSKETVVSALGLYTNRCHYSVVSNKWKVLAGIAVSWALMTLIWLRN